MSCQFLFSVGFCSLLPCLPLSLLPAPFSSCPVCTLSAASSWEGHTEAPGCAPFSLCQMAQPSWKRGLPVSTYNSVSTAISVFTLFPKTHTAAQFSFHVHFCIWFMQGSLIRGCHIPLQERVSCTAGYVGIGKVCRCCKVRVSPSPAPAPCTQLFPYDGIEWKRGTLYEFFFFIVIRWLIKIAPTRHCTKRFTLLFNFCNPELCFINSRNEEKGTGE